MCELEIQLLHMVCGAWLGYQTRLSGWRGMMECVWLHHNLFSICTPNTLKLRQKKCCYQISGGAVYERMHQDPTSRCNWSQPQLLGAPWRAVQTQTSINLSKSFLKMKILKVSHNHTCSLLPLVLTCTAADIWLKSLHERILLIQLFCSGWSQWIINNIPKQVIVD